ncbi:hypothetical protein [Aquipuribacter sp. MA13-6]|uniref:hypothetical protein n=1 Tax=unclassified Aquipuribacter TaxID=2635084 RepID=UPI003EED80FB
MRRSKIVLLLGVMVLAGCAEDGGSDEGLNLSTPPTLSPATASPPASAAPTDAVPSVEPSPPAETATPEEAAVLDAYRAFYVALDQAQADPQSSQTHLDPVATGAQLEQANGAIKANLLAGEESVGTPVLRPVVYLLETDRAVVRDCQDTTAVVRRDIESKEPLIVGQDPDSLEATLVQVDGVWKVAATNFPDDPGAFC